MMIKNDNVLDIKVDIYDKCGWCENNKETLEIPWQIMSEWREISRRMGKCEWGAVFWVEDGKVVRYEVPEQEVESAEVEFKEEIGGDGIVHSHHSMNFGHSSQDDKHCRNLYDWSVILFDSGYEACRKVKLPCGGWAYSEVEIDVVDCPELPMEKIKRRVVAIAKSCWKYVNGVYKKVEGDEDKKDDDVSNKPGIEVDGEYRDPYDVEMPEACRECKETSCQDCLYQEDLEAWIDETQEMYRKERYYF